MTVEPAASPTALDFLRRRQQWVAWTYYPPKRQGAKPRKVPINPRSGRPASTTDPSTWASYEEALSRKDDDRLAGIGYVLTADDGLGGGDLDNVRDKTSGELIDWAAAIVAHAETYCEISPSGTGLRFFWLGKPETAINANSVEIYGDGRYLTITGWRIDPCPDAINEAPLTVAALLDQANPESIEVEEGLTEEHVEDEFDKLNTFALRNLDGWVPELFGARARKTRLGYRVSSDHLGRALEEDVAITFKGIKDFGVHDMGDARGGRRTPITLIMETKTLIFDDAVGWLCKALGVQKPGMVLSPDIPWATAVALMKARFTNQDDTPILRRHRNSFWVWRENYYQMVDDETIETSFWHFLQASRRRGKKGTQPFNPKPVHVRDAAKSLQALVTIDPFINLPAWIRNSDMPPADQFLCCGNGLLHIPTRQIYSPTPDFFSVSASGVIYDDQAPEPVQWLEFLSQTLDDDEAIQLAQEWCGYLLTPDTSQQKILYCEGPKRSGKGTFARILTALLGRDSVAGPTLNSLGENFGLEPLITKPVAIISDARIGARTNKPAVVERLLSISGEDQLSVDRKFMTAWHGRLATRFMIMTNEPPALSEGSGAFVGRLMGLMFQHSFYGREDQGLTNRLSSELSGILNWALEGQARLQQRGHFLQPANAIEQLDQMELLGSPIKAFLRDCCDIDPGASCSSEAAWAMWKDWCREQNDMHVGSKVWFGRGLRMALPGLLIRHLGRNGEDGAHYFGFRLRAGGFRRAGSPASNPLDGDIPF